jgi:hypothetical protein
VDDRYPGLTAVLERLAESGRTSARTTAPQLVRRAAERRTARRRFVSAGLLIVALLGGVGLLTDAGDGVTPAPVPPATSRPSPVPTQLATATADGSSTVRRLLSDDLLVTEEQVAATLGSEWMQTASGRGTTTLSPCQTEPRADPHREVARSVVFIGGWSGENYFSQLVEQSADEDAARKGYLRAVEWFADCGSTGVDQSDAAGSLTRRVAAQPAVVGVDDMRVVVRMREKIGSSLWTNTVAAVIRAGNLVTVLMWDVTIDDNPGAYDDGFVRLTGQMAHRIAGSEAPQVPDSVLVSGSDSAVRQVLGESRTTYTSANGVLDLDPQCNRRNGPAAPETVATSRTSQTVGAGTSAILVEVVALHASEEAARAAADAGAAMVGVCPDDEQLPGSTKALPVSFDGVEGRAWSSIAEGDGPPEIHHSAVLRSGPLVAYLVLDSLNTEIRDEQAQRIFGIAAQRLEEASR